MPLNALHSGLARVRRFRTSVRYGSAWARFASIVLWVLLGAFVLDVMFHMGRVERAIVLLFFLGMTIWSFGRYVLPAMRVREDPITLALLVERQQGIGSDLVAAIQFADGRRAQYGSGDLRQAVVDYTDEVSLGLNYLEGFDRNELLHRAIVLLVTVLVALIPVVAFPGHVAAFGNRLMLGSAHYPSDTKVDAITVMSPASAAGGPAFSQQVIPGEHTARMPFGQPVRFIVQAHGELPDDGRVELEAKSSGLTTTVELLPSEDDPSVFTGELNRALDDLSYVVYLGDFYTEPLEIELIPLADVEVDLRIDIPDYAADRFDAGADDRRVALEGSTITPFVWANDKTLTSATITINGVAKEMTKVGDRFTLTGGDPGENPLAYVTDDVRYEINVVDADGLSLDRPITGVVPVRADRLPRIGVATKTRYVVTNAAPQVRFRAEDDFGIELIRLHRSVVRDSSSPFSPSDVGDPANGGGNNGADANNADDTDSANADNQSDGGAAGGTDRVQKQQPIVIVQPRGGRAVLDGTINVELADLNLSIGDRVEVVFEVIDHRGSLEGRSTRSERIVYQVTDLKTVLAAQRELDAQMDRKLDQIIDAQLGGGGTP